MQNRKVNLEANVVPKHLLAPPDSLVDSKPVFTRIQELPFHRLSWQNFEKLVYRLASKNCDVEYCATYGRSGQSQNGIDIFARLSGGRYVCWQAKNRKEVTASQISEAVDEFLNGKWVESSVRFILCSNASFQDTNLQDTIEKHALDLQKKGIVFEAVDGQLFSEKLREYPEIIDDFFGREWLIAFAGEEAAASLRRPLDTTRVLSLRVRLAEFYEARIHQLDPGLTFEPGQAISCKIRKRFVLPNVDPINLFVEPSLESTDRSQVSAVQDDHTLKFDEYSDLVESSDLTKLETERLETPTVTFEDWFLQGDHSLLILGAPGSGKSTVLRCLALELASTPDYFSKVTERFGARIPLLIPFALWSRLAMKQNREVGLHEVIRETFGAFFPQSKFEESLIEALYDERLLLLIDGLDEYSDEQAARTTLVTIESFVRTHNVHTIMTSRPAGIRRLVPTVGNWETARLTELLPHQQRDLVTKLLSEQEEVTVPIELRVEQFFQQLERNGRLQSLAGNPLLLYGLLSVAARQIILPKTRFDLFQKLIEILLDVHPSRRATAASEVESRSHTFSTDDVRREALGKLAFKMQIAGTEAGIDRDNARKIVQNFLNDSDSGPGWSLEKARNGAGELVNVNADTSGLLVENGPNEIAFCHAAFREYLAGRELATWPLVDQTNFVTDHADEPRWRGTILTLIQSMNRKNEIEDILKAIQEKDKKSVDSIDRRLLLADCAFATASLSGTVGRAVGFDSLNQIEEGTNDAERLELLGLALDGPRAGPIGEEIVNRLARWCPDVSHWDESLYTELGNWPASNELARTLQLALQGDRSQLAAAASLAKVFGGSMEVSDELIKLIHRAANPWVTAATLHALNRGWPSIDGLEDWLKEADQSPSTQLRSIAALELYRRGRRGNLGRDSLLSALSAGWNTFSYGLHEEIIEALVATWGNDSELQNACWAAVGVSGPSKYDIRYDEGLSILMRLHKENPRVPRWIENEITNRGLLPLSTVRMSDYSLLEPIIVEHANVRAAVNKYFSQKDLSIFDHSVAQLAPVVKSNTAKQVMMSQLDEAGIFRFWQVWGLLRGWGIDDPEVANLLKPLARGSAEDRQHIAHHIPEIVGSPGESFELLVEICHLKTVKRLDFVILGFVALGDDIDDAQAVSAILPHVSKRRGSFTNDGALITRFHADPRIREFALRRIHEPSPPLGEMASVYRDDAEIASLLLKRATPLPKLFRQFIARRATQRFDDSALALVLNQSELDSDEHTMVQATIGLSYAALTTPDSVEERTELLRKQLQAVGPNYDVIRVAAFGGLLALGRIDVFADAKDTHKEDALRIDVVDRFKDYAPVLELVAEKWEMLESTMGESLINRLNKWSDGRSYFWRSFSPYLSRSPRLRSAFFEYCNDSSVILEAPALQALSQFKPRSSLLFDCCMRILTGEPNDQQASPLDNTRSVVMASKFLATAFFEDSSAISAIVDASERLQTQGGAIVGLATKWPDHEIVVREYRNLIKEHSHQMLTCVDLWLISAQGTPEQVANAFGHFVTRLTASPWDFPQEALEAFRARLERDSKTVDAIVQLATNHDEPSIRASSIRLLMTTSSYDAQELTKDFLAVECQRSGPPRFALDILTNCIRPAKELMREMQKEPSD